MAYTIPTGYEYWDASASKTYTAGQSFTGTPAAGDSLHGVSASLKGIYYFYRNAQSLPPVVSSGNQDISVSAGWTLSFASHTGSATSYTCLAVIANKDVVYVQSAYKSGSKITSLTIPSNSKLQFINMSQDSIVSLKGTMPSTLKYFSAYNNSALTSVPSFSACVLWTYGLDAFYHCTKLVTAPVLPSSLTILDNIFNGCTSLTTGATIPSSATSASYAYYKCTNLTAAPKNNSSRLTSLAYCFKDCTALTTAANFTINGTANLNADYIFSGCINLVNPPQITQVQSLKYAFYNCSKLISLPASLPSSVTNAIVICYNCSSLTNFPDMSETSITDLESSFYKCSALQQVPSAYLPTGVLNLKNTFNGCTSLTTVPLLHERIHSLYGTFSGCTGLSPQNIYIPSTVTNLQSTFYGCTNLSGIVTIDRTLGEINHTFRLCPLIVITGNNNFTNTDLSIMGSNVYRELEIEPNKIEAIRCSDTNGTLDDEGEYILLKAAFETVVPANSQIYIPKVYIGTDQQIPQIDWKLTNLNTEQTTTISDSTDITADRILAGDLITKGQFESYFLIGEDEVLSYIIKIGTSADNVYQLSNDNIIAQTKYWGGKPGSAVFTSSTFIFDATPDGKGFKIGGPINDNSIPPETGFIVGNAGIVNVSDQYPSTFNGPVNFNSTVKIKNIELLNLFYPIGSYYETSDANFDPNTAWGGTWTKLGEGQVLLSAGSTYIAGTEYGENTKSYTPAGTVDSHTLVANEIPAHTHGSESLIGYMNVRKWNGTGHTVTSVSGIASMKDSTGTGYPNAPLTSSTPKLDLITINATHEHSSVGGGKGHTHGFTGTKATLNVMQKSTAAYIWHRTA